MPDAKRRKVQPEGVLWPLNHGVRIDAQGSVVERGCGYCTHCGYGGEPSSACLHKVRPQEVA